MLTSLFQYDRITLSRLTTTYFIFSVAHFVIQLILQTMAFQINANASSLFNRIIIEGNGTVEGFTVLGSDLRLCTSVPQKALDTSSCQVIWTGSPMDMSTLAWSNSSGSMVHESMPADVDVSSSESSVLSSSSESSVLSAPSTPAPSSTTSVATSSTLLPSVTSSANSSIPTTATEAITSHVVHTITVTLLETSLPSQISRLDEAFVKVSRWCI